MTGKRFHWDWKTGRMKDTYSSFQATKDMRLIERQVNDACQSYEKQIAKLEKENEQLKTFLESLREELSLADRDNTTLEKENEQLKNICKNLIHEVNKRGITVTMTDNCKELLE